MIANRIVAVLGLPATVFAASFFWTLVSILRLYLVRNIIIRYVAGFCIGLIILAVFIVVAAAIVKKAVQLSAIAEQWRRF